MAVTNHDIAVVNLDADDELFRSVVMKALMTLQMPVKVRDTKYFGQEWIVYRRNMEPFREYLKFLVMNALDGLGMPMKAENHSSIDEIDLVLTESGMIVANSVSLLEKVIEKLLLLNQYPTHIQIVIVCPNVTFKEIETLPDSKFLQKVYFLIEDESSVKVLTFGWFTEGNCYDKQLMVVNQFKMTTGWKSKSFEIQKFKDFHGCKIGIGVIRDFPATFYLALRDKFKNPLPPSQIEFAGYYVTMIQEISSNLNFTYAFNPSLTDILIDLGDFYSRYYFKDVKVDLRIVSCSSTVYLTDAFLAHVTNAHAFAENLLLIPPGELFSDLEKFLLPFDTATWICIVIVFVTAVSIIFAISFGRKQIRDEVFGVSVQNPCLNLFAHFFGIGQNVLPKKDFPRILLMTFVIFSLIVRSAYQSKTFEFLQKDLRKPDIKTIDELIEKNFTFHVHGDHFDGISDLDVFQRARYVEEKFERLYVELSQGEIFDPSFKGAIQISSKLMGAVIKVTDGKALQRLLKNYRLNVEAIGMCFPPNHKFFEVFEEITDRLMAAGILQRWIKLVYDWKEKKYAHLRNQGPKKLSMDDLEFGFLICAVSLCFAFLVFFVECIPKCVDSCKRHLAARKSPALGTITN